MKKLRFCLSKATLEGKVPLLVSSLALALTVFGWLAWGHANASATKSVIMLDSGDYFWLRSIFLISSIILVVSLSIVLLKHKEWLESSTFADRYHTTKISVFLNTCGIAFILAIMLIMSWKTPRWTIAFQVTVWLLLCSSALELKPEIMTLVLRQAGKYPKRSFTEIALLAYSRRFTCAVIGLLCSEVGAWIVYIMTYDSVVNYSEGVAALFIVTLAMYMLLYIPFCWGGVCIMKEKKRSS